MAEFWADGPKSETPPGHWNVARQPGLRRARPRTCGSAAPGRPSIGCSGTSSCTSRSTARSTTRRSPPGASRATTTRRRPISMIRYMGGLGQSSDPDGAVLRPGGPAARPGPDRGHHRRRRPRPGGATPRSPATRARSRSGPGPAIPTDPKTQTGGVGWILAVDWVPYQLPTFVTPAFPGYISGHSTFSRAAAEVLTGVHRQRVLPGRHQRLHDQGRVAQVRERARRRTSGSSGRPTTTPPTRPASRGCTAASTSRPTTSPAGRIGSRVRQGGLGAGAAVLRGHGRRRDDPSRRGVAASCPVRRRRSSRSWSLVASPSSRSAPSRCSRPGGADVRPPGPPRFVDETATVGRRPRLRRRRRRSSSAAASPSSTATTTAGRTSTSPGGADPAALYRNDSPVGGRAPLRAGSTDPATDLDRASTGAYPLDIDGDGHDRPRRPAGRRERRSCAASATAASSAPTRPGRSTAATAGRRRSARPGRARRRCRPSPSGNYLDARRGRRADGTTAPTTSCSGPTPPAPATRRRSPLAPGYCTLSMLFSDWDRSGPARPAGDQRPALLPRRRGPAVADRRRARRRALYTARRRLGADADLGHGHRQLRPDRRRLPGGLPHEPGRQQAPDAGRRRRASRPTATSRSSAASPPPGRSPAATSLPSTAWHPEFEDVNNDGFIDLFVSKGNVERACPTTPQRTRATCSSASRTARSSRRAEAAGHRQLRARPRRRARRPQPRRPARPGRGQPAATPVMLWRNVGCGRRPPRRRRWAAGSRSGSRQPGPNRDAIGAWLEVRVGDDHRCAAS